MGAGERFGAGSRSRRIVVLDGYTLNPGDLSWDGLARFGELTVYDRTPPELVRERVGDADIVLTNKTPLGGETLRSLKRTAYIGVLATGYDVVDVKAAAELGKTVTNVPGYGTGSVAQTVFALLLELCHRVQLHSDSVFAGEWSASKDWCYWKSPLTQLAGKTIGIVGYGQIGRKVGKIARAFDMRVLAARRSDRGKSDERNESGERAWHRVRQAEGREDSDVERVELKELLRVSDVVTLHCPLTPETQGLINAETIGWMKPTAMLVNTSRGRLVVERELADALQEGRIAAAALDVLSVEPPSPDNPLLSTRNCLITPHIAWAAKEAREALLDIAIGNLQAYLDGNPVHVVR